jgi:hypothetical protein
MSGERTIRPELAGSGASIAGTIAYSATIDGESYAVNGSFEVTRCADRPLSAVSAS